MWRKVGAVLLSSCLLCTDIEVLVRELERGIDLREDVSTEVCVEEEQHSAVLQAGSEDLTPALVEEKRLPQVLTLDQVLPSHHAPPHDQPQMTSELEGEQQPHSVFER